MFRHKKEGIQTLLAMFFSLTLAACCVSHAMQPIFPRISPDIPVFNAYGEKLPVIVIDAGHGGMDSGASGVSGVAERDINLAVAQRTEALLVLFGIPTVMTRTDADDIAPGNGYTSIRARKVADMHARAELVNAEEQARLLSIHMNSYPDSRCSGAQVFYSPTDGSEALADAVQEALCAVTHETSPRAVAPVNPGLYLYRSVHCPAVLIECGFLSNPTEEALLKDSAYQTRLGMALAVAGVENIYGNTPAI